MADIPGLIEGASEGRGLGHNFLKHVERTRLLLHLIDITHVPEGDILGDFHVVFRELENYDPSLTGKGQMVIVTKMDLYSSKCRDRAKVKKALDDLHIESIFLSALTGEGMEGLKKALFRKFFDHGSDFKKSAFEAG
jgi:GTP-binding protein